MTPTTPHIPVRAPYIPIRLSPLQEHRDLALARDDLLPQRADEEPLLFVLPDLDLPRRLGAQEVLERLVVDLDVRGTQEELLLWVRADVREDVGHGLGDDTWVARRAALKE